MPIFRIIKINFTILRNHNIRQLLLWFCYSNKCILKLFVFKNINWILELVVIDKSNNHSLNDPILSPYINRLNGRNGTKQQISVFTYYR